MVPLARRALLALLLLLVASPAAAAAPSALSYRLQIVASPAGARGTQPQRARTLGLPVRGGGSLVRLGGRYVAEIRMAGAPADRIAALRAAGAAVLHVSPRYRTVTAAITRGDLKAVAGVRGVEAVTEVLAPFVGRGGRRGAARGRRLNTCTGAKTSEGDTQLRAGLARTDLELDGAGVEVGVLSDSFDTASAAPAPTPVTDAADDVASGDLPGPGNPCGRTAPVDVVQDLDPGDGADEGRGMLQIVHDLAPGADLAFATAFLGETAFADNIVALKDGGADVIVDDVIYGGEPFFQDGPIANAVSEVTDAGVAYFTMAFNDNQIDASDRDIASWEAPAYRPMPCPAIVATDDNFVSGSDCMDFDPAGATTDASGGFGVGVIVGRPLKVDLQWNEPRSGVTTDFDLYLINTPAAAISAESHNVNGTTQTPFEFAFLTAGTSSNRDVVIVRKPGGGTPRLKFVILNNGAPITSFEYPASSGGDIVGPSIFGHNGTAKAQTAGAIAYDNASTAPERFSSRGPVTHYFEPVDDAGPAAPLGAPEVLTKPDVTATDGGANTFFGQDAGGGTFRFYGTSAAAPHAAAVGALQLQGNPGLTPTEVKDAQKSTATAIGAFGPDAVGDGLIDARAAVAADLLPPVVTLSPVRTNDTTPTIPFSANRPATFTCALDGAAATACTSPFTPPAPLSEGDHTLVVEATDNAAHIGSSGPVTVTVDLTPPTETIATGPDGQTNVTQPTFSFSADEPIAQAECRVDADAFGACSDSTSHLVDTPLAEGPHTFEVRATDVAGNTGTADSRAFTVDTTPPATPAVTGGPTGPVASTAPTFTFTGDAGVTFACRFDAAAFAACSGAGTHTPATPLSEGSHTFEVQAVDAAGNSSTAGSRSFSVDTVAPAALITAGPSGETLDTQPSFTFESSESGSTFECRFDTDSLGACSGATTHAPAAALSLGDHTFTVRATDALGNRDDAGTSRSFKVVTSLTPPPSTGAGATPTATATAAPTAAPGPGPDVVKPVLSFTKRPKARTKSRKARFKIAATEALAKLECKLDKGEFKPCAATRRVKVKPGKHTFRVRGTDLGGNVSAEVKVTWRVKRKKN